MKAIFKNLLVMLIFLMGGAAYISAQPTVKGKVTDSDGRPLEGVVILVQGTTNGTMTDLDGSYYISSLKKGDILVFSSLGLAEQTFECTGSLSKLDVIMKDDVDRATGIVGQRSEAGMDNSLTYCYCVEGGAEIAKEITKGTVPVIGSIYVEQYLGDFTPFGPAVTQALKSTDGVMIFDIVHLNKHKLWDELKAAMKAGLK